MRLNLKLTNLIFLILITSSGIYAQQDPPFNPEKNEPSIEETNKLFLMTDKTIYVPYEYIWFSGYQLGPKITDTSLHSLYVLLADRYTKKILTSGRFILVKGFSTGRLFLPGTIVDGNYALIAYTDNYLQGKPEVIFSKNISLRSTRESKFTVLPLEAQSTSRDTVKLKYFVTTPNSGIAVGADVSYRLYADTALFQQGKQKTNKQGEIYITIPHKMDSIIKNWELVLNVTKDTLSKTDIFPVSDKFVYRLNTQPVVRNEQQEPSLISITSDSAYYHCRSKVKLKIKCVDANNKPVYGVFSLSCALSRRLTDNKDINDYYNADHHLISLTSPKDTSEFIGRLLYNDRKIKKPQDLLLMGGLNKLNRLSTDVAGNFSISTDMLLGESESDLTLSVVNKSPEGYSLHITEPDVKMNQQLAAIYYPVGFAPSIGTGEDALTEQEKQLWKNMLKAVTVTGRTADSYDFSGMDACGDWTCSCGHWLCDGCPPRLAPVKGKAYLDKRLNRTFVFTGCLADQPKTYIKKVQALSVPKMFPVFDYKSTDKELFTTLFWAPFITTDEKGEAELVFYTNDLKGVFKYMLQGVSTNRKGCIQASGHLSVKD